MKTIKTLLVIGFLVFSISISKAEYFLNFGEFLTIYFNTIGSHIPKSYQYIKLDFKNIETNSDTYSALQKGVYMNLFPNKKIDLKLNNKVNQKQVASLIKNNFGINLYYQSGLVTSQRLKEVIYLLDNYKIGELNTQDEIMLDVYDTLTNDFLFQEKVDEKNMVYGAIKGMVNSLDDPYTEFLDPSEAKDLNDELNGDFEGIGAYIEKNKKGETIISSPIKGSPAEKAGLQAGDIIININNKQIEKEESITNIVKMIKGPSGSKVKIQIKRGDNLMTFSITREKITIQNIEYKKLDNNTCYIGIYMFIRGIDQDFSKLLSQTNGCKKYIFDLRNNPGGGLYEVSNMLGHFIPDGEKSSVIKNLYISENLIPDNKLPKIEKNIIILINKGSASASEIFAGTIKDYIPSTLLIGEQTFGKGSVQSIKNYTDGSILKYTQAKRYTGKTQRNIDKQGIHPDINIIDNPETEVDEIIEFAKKIQF